MKTLEIANLGIEELSTNEMINNHGGGDNTSVGNIGGIVIGDLVDVSGNSLFGGDSALFSGNSTNVSNGLTTLLGLSSNR